jgi:phenylacetate-CoA ligase
MAIASPDKTYKKYWDEELETMSRPQLRDMQTKLLKETLDWCYAKSPYYKKTFDEAGISLADFKSIEDIKKLPFISKYTLRERQQAVPLLGDLTCVPEEEVVFISVSSGSTGVPTASPFTAQDFEEFQDYEARLFWSSGMRPNDRYCHALNFTLFVGGPDVIGAQKVGALCIWAGAIPAERLLSILMQWKATCTWTTPSYAWFLGETAKLQGIDPKVDLCIERLMVAGEPGGSIPETREKIQELWGANLYDYYGLSDIFGACAGMCEAREGLHWAEDHILVEVINPETGEEVPEGERGEMVLTTLKKKARPLIRFRTSDIVSYTTERCSCGRTHLRLHGIHGRLDDMLIIKGVNVFPSDIEAIVRKNPDFSGEYRLIVGEEQHLATLTVEAEHAPGFPGNLEGLGEKLREECYSVLGIRPRVKVLPPETIPRAVHKAKRVIDTRKGETV